jgi:hypothetical protein
MMAVCSMFLLAACGGGSDGGDQPTAETAAPVESPEQPTGSLDQEALVEAADTNCTYQDGLVARLGPSGKTVAGIAQQWGGMVPVLEEIQGLQSGLEAESAVATTWDQYLKSTEQVITSASALSEVTTEGPEFTKASTDLGGALQATYGPADELGLKVCTHTPEPTVEETVMVNPETFDLPEASNTVDEAADTFITAVNSEDCAKINAVINSDVGELNASNCEYLVGAYAGLKPIGNQSFGPVAFVEFGGTDAPRNGTAKFIMDTDLELKYTGEAVIPGGGIHPPSEGFDAQESMDAALAAIRDEDGTAFMAVQGPDSSVTEVVDPFTSIGDDEGADLVSKDIRDNPDVEAVMIGANQMAAAFIFDTGENVYLLENGHTPGSETSYGNFGYWLLPAS